MSINKDQAKGRVKEAAGKVQESAGKMVGSARQQADNSARKLSFAVGAVAFVFIEPF